MRGRYGFGGGGGMDLMAGRFGVTVGRVGKLYAVCFVCVECPSSLSRGAGDRFICHLDFNTSFGWE